MDDHKLNKAMVDFCGERQVPIPGSKNVYIAKGDQGGTTKWDPVHKWEQVFAYVIPALNQLGCDVEISNYKTGRSVLITAHKPLDLGWWKVLGGAEGDNPPPRFVCEAALKVPERIAEADNAK